MNKDLLVMVITLLTISHILQAGSINILDQLKPIPDVVHIPFEYTDLQSITHEYSYSLSKAQIEEMKNNPSSFNTIFNDIITQAKNGLGLQDRQIKSISFGPLRRNKRPSFQFSSINNEFSPDVSGPFKRYIFDLAISNPDLENKKIEIMIPYETPRPADPFATPEGAAVKAEALAIDTHSFFTGLAIANALRKIALVIRNDPEANSFVMCTGNLDAWKKIVPTDLIAWILNALKVKRINKDFFKTVLELVKDFSPEEEKELCKKTNSLDVNDDTSPRDDHSDTEQTATTALLILGNELKNLHALLVNK